MKKLTIIFSLILFCFCANAISFTVVGCSFNESEAISPGSIQYIDFKLNSPASTSDSIKIYITHNNGNLKIIFREKYWTYCDTLKINSDSSLRLFFKMPVNYTDGGFSLALLNSIQNEKGILSSTSAVLNPVLPENKDLEFSFYDQSGIFKRRCKFSELESGFYLGNGFKFYKD